MTSLDTPALCGADTLSVSLTTLELTGHVVGGDTGPPLQVSDVVLLLNCAGGARARGGGGGNPASIEGGGGDGDLS